MTLNEVALLYRKLPKDDQLPEDGTFPYNEACISRPSR